MERRFRHGILFCVLILAACARAPVTDEVTVEIEKNDWVRVTAQTTFNDADVNTTARLALLEAGRFAAINGNDAWAARFGRVTAEDDEVTFEKHRGTLDRVTRSVRIPSNQLQQVFSDTNITVNILNGPGWRELSFIPGGSIRATREQRRHFEDSLVSWSGAVARYFAAINGLYAYMNANPRRAPALFTALMNEKSDDALAGVAEEEQPLVDNVTAAMEEIGTRMDETQDGAATFGEEANLIYNAFPARMTIRLPGEVLSIEGFGKELVIEPVNLLDAITSLEGKWISPDPLAALLREQPPSGEQLAQRPRQSVTTVQATDIADAIREKLARPRTYVVRWRG
jgi:virulence-associated protein VagC